MTRYNLLRNGKVVFWDLSENELIDRLEDFAVEQYVTGEKISEQITYEPVKEEELKWQRECYQVALIIVMLDPKRLDKEEESILNTQRPLVTRLARDTVDKENETSTNRRWKTGKNTR